MEGRMMPGLSLDEILAILPHRYPFLLVDRIIEVEERRVVGIKNVTINEPFFPGHIPGFPVMPGVLVVEAMAQVGAVLVSKPPAPAGPPGLPRRYRPLPLPPPRGSGGHAAHRCGVARSARATRQDLGGGAPGRWGRGGGGAPGGGC